MSFRINTNINAMTALRSLNMTSEAQATASQRLSTGLRINSGADDPSGLIAAQGYKSQIGGLSSALSNNQAAMNYAKTAEGGLDEVNNLLSGARALAIANGNASLDSTAKAANQTQLNNILSSIDRIAQTTQFGSKKLLDGSSGVTANVVDTSKFANASFTGNFGSGPVTVGGNADVSVTTAAAFANVNGSRSYSAGTVLTGAGSFSLNGTTFTTTATTTRDQLVAQLNAASAQTGVLATTGVGVNLSSTSYGSAAKINLADATGVISVAPGTATASGVDAVASVTFGGQTVSFNQGSGLNLKDASGNTIGLTAAGNTTGLTANALQVSAGAANFQIGANAGQTAVLSLGKFDSGTLGLSGLDISGVAQAASLTAIDSAITNVSNARGNIGSFMKNTLQSNIRSLGVAQENMSATLSNIQDTDVAAEMTNYSKLQILNQSGISMLTQANSGPQSVLALLRG